jgi:hypothetical protein
MKILSVGTMSGLSNTCLHRCWALEKIADEIDVVNTTERPCTLWYRIAHHLFLWGLPVRLPDSSGANRKILEYVAHNQYDIVWIDKGITINPETLRYIKKVLPQTKIVSFWGDNPLYKITSSQNYMKSIPLFDYHITTKSYILDDMRKLGAKQIHFSNNSYEASFHYPRILTDNEMQLMDSDVGFVGRWEKGRCESILYLAANGIKVKVFGDGKWNEYKNISNLEVFPALMSENYSKALQAFKISLAFLSKLNFDQQTTRSVEIPACGGFMMAERTKEHLALFEEGKEAEFFTTNEELLEKCRYYLINEDERKRIAEAGNLRCQTSGYSNEETIKRLITIIMSDFR